MIFIGTLQNTLSGGAAGITFGIIFGIIIFILFKIRIFNDEYQTDPLSNYNSLLKKYSLLIKSDINAPNVPNVPNVSNAPKVDRLLQKGLKNTINKYNKLV